MSALSLLLNVKLIDMVCEQLKEKAMFIPSSEVPPEFSNIVLIDRADLRISHKEVDAVILPQV